MSPYGYWGSLSRLTKLIAARSPAYALLSAALYCPFLAGEVSPPLRPLPPLRMDALESAVQEQLREIHAEVESIGLDPSATDSQRAEAYGGFGRLLHSYELFESAEGCYRNAQALAPGEFRWTYLLATALERQGRWGEAVEQFRAALSIHSESIPALVRLGNIHLQSGDLNRAEEKFRQAVRLDLSSAAAHFGLGQVKLLQRQYDAAVEHLESALALAPEADLTHYSLGMAYRGAGEFEKAQHHLGRAGTVGVRPHDPLTYELESLGAGEIVATLRGRRAFEAGRFEDAIQEFQRAADAAPDSYRSRTNLAAALAEAGRTDEAIIKFRKAIELNQEGAEVARANLARLLIQTGRPGGAIPLLRVALSRRPSDLAARIDLAKALGLTGDFPTALQTLAPALAARPPHAESKLLEVDLLIRMGLEEPARERLDTLQSELPRDPVVQQRYALFLATALDPRLRDPALSLQLARKAYAASPTLFGAEALFYAHLANSACSDAQQWLDEVAAAGGPAERVSRLHEALLEAWREGRCGDRQPE